MFLDDLFESDDLFASPKTTPQKMAALIRAGKEIWVKDSRDEIWKIKEVKPDPLHPWRYYAHWEYGEFPVDNEEYRLDTLDADGSSYILRPIERFDENDNDVFSPRRGSQWQQIGWTLDDELKNYIEENWVSSNEITLIKSAIEKFKANDPHGAMEDIGRDVSVKNWWREMCHKHEIGFQLPDQLDEGASSILYHYTSPMPALKILQSGEFELTSSIGSPSEAKINPKGYPYFLSTTRSKVGDYHARHPGSFAVMFVLDGNRLSQNYKVKPVDYWEGMWQSDTSGQRTRESEDRVFSKTPSIPIAGIVKEIHQLVTDHDEFRSPVIRKLAIIAKVEGIPIYFYTNKESWLTQNPKDRVNVSKISKSFKGQSKPGWTSRSRRITTLEQWIELIHKKDKKELTPEANKLRFNIVYYGSRYPDEDQGLSIELTNARKPGEPERKYAAKIIDYMRKYNLNTAGLKNAMVEKWSFPI